MREYYIRREGDEDSSGPYDIDQISSLIEANKLDAEAYYYEIESETWEKISSSQELMDTLFPKKRKLTLRTEPIEAEPAPAEETIATTDEDGNEIESTDPDAASPEGEAKKTPKAAPEKEEPHEKLEVTKMLALAEGRADDPTGKSPREKQAAVAFYGMRALTLYFITSIVAMAYMKMDLLLTANVLEIVKSPYLLIAIFDVVMTAFLFLQVTEVYPLLRFRAAVGAGLLTLLFYGSGDTILLISNLLLMVAIYFSSAIIKIRYLLACTAVGLLGMFGYAYVLLLA